MKNEKRLTVIAWADKGRTNTTKFMGSFYPSPKYKRGIEEDHFNKENIIPCINYRPTHAMKNAEMKKVKE